jgi:16S rRNA processing protein RimM
MAVVGRIARAHGIRGQVIVNPETDFLEQRFYAGALMFLGRNAADCRQVSLTAARFQNGRPVIAIDGIAGMDAAIALAGSELRVPAADLPALPEGTYYRHDLVGCTVETADGTIIGEVAAVEGAGVESRLAVNGAHGEVLIPLAAQICTTIDPANRRIVIAPPDGLLELNVRERKS